MADNGLGGLLSPVKDAFTGGGATTTGVGGGSALYWIIGLIIGILVVSVIVTIVWFLYFDKKKWNIITRVHYENPTIKGVSFGSGGGIPTRRLRFKDGRVVYLYKSPIQGYTVSPELLTWTRPREHDVIVTQDKRLFCLIGIENIDTKRKKLNVDITYPDIEMDRQDLQNFVDSKKFDDPKERLKIIAKVATWIFILVTVIVLTVLGGKYYIEGKNADIQRDQINLQVTDGQKQVMESVHAFTLLIQKQYGNITLNDYVNINS
jgi:hypothetical protein